MFAVATRAKRRITVQPNGDVLVDEEYTIVRCWVSARGDRHAGAGQPCTRRGGAGDGGVQPCRPRARRRPGNPACAGAQGIQAGGHVVEAGLHEEPTGLRRRCGQRLPCYPCVVFFSFDRSRQPRADWARGQPRVQGWVRAPSRPFCRTLPRPAAWIPLHAPPPVHSPLRSPAPPTKTALPLEAMNIYFRDGIGNISTSVIQETSGMVRGHAPPGNAVLGPGAGTCADGCRVRHVASGAGAGPNPHQPPALCSHPRGRPAR